MDVVYDTSSTPTFDSINPVTFGTDNHDRVVAYVRATSSVPIDDGFQNAVAVDGSSVPAHIHTTRKSAHVLVLRVEVAPIPTNAGLLSLYFHYPSSSKLAGTPVVAIPLRLGAHFDLSHCANNSTREGRFLAITVTLNKPGQTKCSVMSTLPTSPALSTADSRWLNVIPLCKDLTECDASELSGDVYPIGQGRN